MIQILTLFLGLVVGPHPVELAVDPSVAAVDLRLDGATAARLDEPPWQALVDFGPELVPHELEALAIDGAGKVADRARREVNRPRPEAEAIVFLERDPEGRPVAGRVTWETVGDLSPIETNVTLDGEALEVVSLDHFPLPRAAGDDFHFLQVDLYFAGGVSAHTQVVYGGAYLDETGSELTAVPVVFTKGKARKPAELDGWFLKDGAPQRVVAVEKGPAEIIVVRTDSVSDVTKDLEGQGFGIGSTMVGGGLDGTRGPAGRGASASGFERGRKALAFGDMERLRLLLPQSREIRHERVTHRAFVISPRLDSRQGGLYWALTQDYYAPGMSASERVADAVAVAGMRAAWGNRRRAVVLALAGDAPDLSTLSPRAVRTYLRTLDVPLFVWHFDAGDGGAGSARVEEWPEAERIGSFQDLKRAVRALRKRLDKQRVVWVDGHHPAETIRLADSAQAERIGTYY